MQMHLGCACGCGDGVLGTATHAVFSRRRQGNPGKPLTVCVTGVQCVQHHIPLIRRVVTNVEK